MGAAVAKVMNSEMRRRETIISDDDFGMADYVCSQGGEDVSGIDF